MSKSEHENLRADIAPTNKVQVAAILKISTRRKPLLNNLPRTKVSLLNKSLLLMAKMKSLARSLRAAAKRLVSICGIPILC